MDSNINNGLILEWFGYKQPRNVQYQVLLVHDYAHNYVHYITSEIMFGYSQESAG